MADSVVDYSDYPRSILLSLKPLHLQTADAESLYSYEERLIGAHSITRTALRRRIIEQCTGVSSSKRPADYCRPDSPNVRAATMATALAHLTAQPAVTRMGLGWLHNVLSCHDTMRSLHAWCPHCLREAFHGRTPSYLPLIWSLRSAEVCLHHDCLLSSNCARCGFAMSAYKYLQYPFATCPKCLSTLWAPSHITRIQPTAQQVEATRCVAKWLESMQKMPADAQPMRPDPRRASQSAVNRGIAKSAGEVLRMAAIEKSTLHAVDHGRVIGLEPWVRLSMAADIALEGLFIPEQWRESINGHASAWCSTATSSRRTGPVDWNKMKSLAQEALNKGTPPTFHAFCTQHRIDAKHAGAKLRQLRERMDLAAATAANASFDARVSTLLSKFQVLADELRSEGVRLSKRAFARRLNLSRSTTEFRAAYAKFFRTYTRPLHE